MSKGIEVRQYQHGDEDEIVPLLELAFDGWPNFDINCTPLEHWKWKFLDNPLKIDTVVVGTINKQIIGCGHGYNVKIRIRGRSSLCHYGCDLAVHPDFRRLGLMKTMREKKNELREKNKVDYTYRVTRNPIVFESWNRMGRPRFPRAVVNLVRIQDIDEQLEHMPVKNAFFKKLGFKTARLFNALGNLRRSEDIPQNLRVNEIERFDDRIDGFWEEISNHYDFIVERQRGYLNWRYCDPRAGDFVVKQVEEDGMILGYSVLKINRIREAYPVGYIVDLITLPHRLEAADVLVADAIKYFDENDINIVNYLMVKNHPSVRAFNKYGFIDSRFKIHLFYTFHGLKDDLRKLRTSRRIHFSYGDIDSLPALIL